MRGGIVFLSLRGRKIVRGANGDYAAPLLGAGLATHRNGDRSLQFGMKQETFGWRAMRGQEWRDENLGLTRIRAK